MYWKKCNAEFNLDIFIFSLIKSLSCNKILNMIGLSVLCITRMSLLKRFTKNVQN